MKTIYTASQLKSIYGTPQNKEEPVVNTPVNKNIETTNKDNTFQQASVGLAKGILQTSKGLGELGQKYFTKPVEQGINKLAGFDDSQTNTVPIFEQGTPEEQKATEALKATTPTEKVFKTAEQIAEFAIPATKAEKGIKTAGIVRKLGTRALTSAGVASAQAGEVGKDAGIAAATEVVLPVVGKAITKVAKPLVTRILKGTGSALSGASMAKLDEVINNPEIAIQKGKELKKLGNDTVIRQNVDTIRQGAAKIIKDARSAYGKVLEQLSQTDIDNKIFKEQTQSILDAYGSRVEGGNRILSNVEFDDPKNLQKASSFIDRLSNVELDGKSLRKLADDIESSVYKVATSDERLSYNVFARDLSNSLKKAISSSTSKLDDINKAYSTDVQIAEAVENELGKIKYTNNLSEIVNASKKLETLFEKNGLAPKVVNDFLEKIGRSDVKISEAVRQIENKVIPSNTIGTNPFEIVRNATAAVVTPKTVKNIAIALSITDKAANKLLQKLQGVSPAVRASVIKALQGGDN